MTQFRQIATTAAAGRVERKRFAASAPRPALVASWQGKTVDPRDFVGNGTVVGGAAYPQSVDGALNVEGIVDGEWVYAPETGLASFNIGARPWGYTNYSRHPAQFEEKELRGEHQYGDLAYWEDRYEAASITPSYIMPDGAARV